MKNYYKIRDLPQELQDKFQKVVGPKTIYKYDPDWTVDMLDEGDAQLVVKYLLNLNDLNIVRLKNKNIANRELTESNKEYIDKAIAATAIAAEYKNAYYYLYNTTLDVTAQCQDYMQSGARVDYVAVMDANHANAIQSIHTKVYRSNKIYTKYRKLSKQRKDKRGIFK